MQELFLYGLLMVFCKRYNNFATTTPEIMDLVLKSQAWHHIHR
jgi:hypothetical protein